MDSTPPRRRDHESALDPSFRQVGPEDEAALAELFGALDVAEFHPHPLTAGHAREIANYRGEDIFGILWLGNRAVAYGILRGWDEGFRIPSLGVAVSPDEQGRGYGTRTVEALHREARLRGAEQVRLRVNPANGRAMRLYQSLGYRPVGTERGQQVMVVDLET